ncbi:hypothetical protein [Streptomyces lincolnensis]|uniref:hypothetical protein n=1 Tax=Streptomyces lincolnensis TaxID=1915 RepID=UPI0037D94E5D
MSIMREFLRRPRLTGTVAPSSAPLAQAMTADLDLENAVEVVHANGRFSTFACLHAT